LWEDRVESREALFPPDTPATENPMKTRNRCTATLLGCAFALAATAGTPLVTLTAELDREVLPADQRQTAVVKISLDAAPPPREMDRPPVNLCIVLDRSGSMSGRKIQHAREAALEALSRLGDRDVFSLVTYESEVQTLIPAGRLGDVDRAREIIQRISSGGNTALFGGVSQGAAEIRKFLEDHPKGMVHRILLLSDGLANVGPSSAEDLGRLGASLMKEGISVTTIGLGNDYNEDLMTSLSQRSDGNTYFVENSGDLARIFNEEIGDVLNVVARDIEVIIRCPERVRPLRTIGRDAVIRDREVRLHLNQLYGKQEKFLLLEVEIPPSPDQSRLPVLDASVSYHNVFTSAREAGDAAAVARFSRSGDEVARNINREVTRDYYAGQSAIAKNEAIERWEAGDQAGAKQVLQDNSLKLRQAAAVYELPVLNAEADNLEEKREDLGREGLTKFNRKSLRTEALQEQNQQRLKQSF
jgi:Ca-activated chloride channel family protein